MIGAGTFARIGLFTAAFLLTPSPGTAEPAPEREPPEAPRRRYGMLLAADLGTNLIIVRSAPEARIGVETGARWRAWTLRARGELVADEIRDEYRVCDLIVGSYCPIYRSDVLGRGALLVGRSFPAPRGRFLELSAGPSWSFSRHWAEEENFDIDTTWTSGPIGVVVEGGARVPLRKSSKSYLRMSLDYQAFRGRPATDFEIEHLYGEFKPVRAPTPPLFGVRIGILFAGGEAR